MDVIMSKKGEEKLRRNGFMALVKIELPISSIDETYSDSFNILAIGRARRLGFANAEALFSKAFKNYDKKMPPTCWVSYASKGRTLLS